MTFESAEGTRNGTFGVFGGTFDPPHSGHTSAVVAAQNQLGLGCVYVVVANDPWQKGNVVAAPEHRLAMCELAFADLTASAEVSVSAIEIERGGPTHTIDTILELQQNWAAKHPLNDRSTSLKPVLIVGEEVARNLDTWHRAAELRELVIVAVLRRFGETSRPPWVPPGWQAVLVELDSQAQNVDPASPDPAIPAVSSTAIRQRLATGPLDTAQLPEVDPKVLAYIVQHDLYSLALPSGSDDPR